MLRIIQNRSAAQAKSYYAHSDYLSESQELTGRWGGRASQLLGLSGDVKKEHFDRLCDNQHPQSGEQLTLRNDTDRTTGYDFNFHLPKGVSLAYAIGGDERILEAFRESVEETMRDVEQDAKTRVRKHGMDTDRTTSNLAWATFIHKTARPVHGEPDPHLHAHAFCFNTTWDQKEEAWKAVQFRDLKRDGAYYQAGFHARMAMRMRGLGYEIRKKGKEWDLAAIPPSLCQKFSRRKDQIEELARTLGIDNPDEKSELGAKSREKKAPQLGMDELGGLWLNRMTAEDQAHIDAARKQAEFGVEPTNGDEREASSMLYAIDHSFERHSVIAERKLLTEALQHGVGHVTVEGMLRQLEQSEVIRREIDGRKMATTRKVLKEESQMIEFAKGGIGQELPFNSNWQIRQEWLNKDQRAAVDHVLRSKNRVIIVKGGAGTGKSSLMREAVDGIEANGRKVFTFAPSSEASRGVLREKGFEATTVAELLVNKKLQKEIEGNVLWIDEAGLLGSRTMRRVFELAEQQHCRVVLSGDWRQHGAVERGAAMRILEQQGGIKPVVVSQIERQTGAYRDAVALLAEGNTEDGFAAFQKMNWVREVKDSSERYEQMARDYADIMARKESVLASAPTHAECDILTDHIRSELQRRGMIDSKSHEVTQLKPMYLTEAEKRDGERILDGDVIVFTQNSKGYRKGQRLRVKEGLPNDLRQHAGRFEVFQEKQASFAKGELLRVTAGGKSKDGHRLDNGTIYRINSFARNGDIRLENGWTIDKDFGFIARGYASTSHSSQGKTVNHVLVAESALSFAAAGREQFYVSMSRGEHSATLYTDDEKQLTEAIQKSDTRMSATELIHGKPAAESLRRQRQKAIDKARDLQHEPVNQLEKGHERA